MMTLQDFTIEAARHIRSYLDNNGEKDVRIHEIEITKSNDNVLHGFSLIRKGAPGGPNIYLDELFRMHGNGADMDEVMELLECITDHVMSFSVPSVPDLGHMSFDDIKSRVTLRLLDVRRNMSFMNDRPYIDVGSGLVLVADINSEERIASEWRCPVNNTILKAIGCSREELLTAAMENTIRLAPPVLMKLNESITATHPVNYLESARGQLAAPDMPMILTNTMSCNGAAVLFYPGMLEAVSHIMSGSYYIIPSSVHEVLILSERADADPANLRLMLREANITVVENADILSDELFYYNAEESQLTVFQEYHHVTDDIPFNVYRDVHYDTAEDMHPCLS